MKVRKKPRPRLAAFPERLTQAWRASGMTQAELAKRLGFNQAVVSHWMAGRSEPGLARLVEIARVLGVTPGYLLGQQDANHRVVRSMLTRQVNALEEMLRIAKDNSESEEPT